MGIARFAREHKWQLCTDMLHTGTMPRDWVGDGIIAFLSYESAFAKSIERSELPVAALSLSDNCLSPSAIQPDNAAIGKLAARHLASRGCRKFIWAPFLDDSQNKERLNGFSSELAKLGYSCSSLPPAHRHSEFGLIDNWSSWRETASVSLGEPSMRAGVFAFNDCLSAEIAALASDLDLRVPDDLAIMGVGNEVAECESTAITLTSIDPNWEELAYKTAESLLALLAGGEATTRTTAAVRPKEIVLRDSTLVSSSGNPRLDQALLFIAENYFDYNLSVTSVAEALKISRRQLERDFRTAVGCTVREHIENTRMAEASRLLLDQPDKTVAEISALVGISAPGNFFRIFRRRFESTPTEYRNMRLPE